MEAKYKEIILGEEICKKLKQMYFPNTEWVDCYRGVADQFSAIKKAAIKFYGDKPIEEILIELQSYSSQDLIDLITY